MFLAVYDASGIRVALKMSETRKEVTDMKKANRHIQRVIDSADRLLTLADRGDMVRDDDGSGVLFATVRDCAYVMKFKAECEKQKRIQDGDWA